MDYDELSILIAWMESPFENSGTWTSVDWWEQEMPEEMADIIAELCTGEPKEELIKVRNGLDSIRKEKKQLEDKWGSLPLQEMCRYLQTDALILRHLDAPIGIDDNPIGTYKNIEELLDFLVDLEVK